MKPAANKDSLTVINSVFCSVCVSFSFPSSFILQHVRISLSFPCTFACGDFTMRRNCNHSHRWSLLRQNTITFTASSTKCILGDDDVMFFVGLDLSRTGAEPRLIAGCLKNVFSSLSGDKAGALPLLLSKSIFCLSLNFFSVFFSISLRF